MYFRKYLKISKNSIQERNYAVDLFHSASSIFLDFTARVYDVVIYYAHRSYEHIYEQFLLAIHTIFFTIANMHQVNDNLLQCEEIVRKLFEVKLISFAIRAVECVVFR